MKIFLDKVDCWVELQLHCYFQFLKHGWFMNITEYLKFDCFLFSLLMFFTHKMICACLFCFIYCILHDFLFFCQLIKIIAILIFCFVLFCFVLCCCCCCVEAQFSKWLVITYLYNCNIWKWNCSDCCRTSFFTCCPSIWYVWIFLSLSLTLLFFVFFSCLFSISNSFSFE
jgi:hypothetical protein